MVRGSIHGGDLLSIKITPQKAYSTTREAIQDKRIWLSGALGGLGVAFCKELLKQGCASIALIDILDETIGESQIHTFEKESWQEIHYTQADVRDRDAVKHSMEKAATLFGGLDIVINNAGVTEENAEQVVIAVNLTAIMTATEAVLQVWKEAEGRDKTIINVSSAGGLFPMPVAPVYAGSKFGVVGYTKSMRNACWERGVRINCFCPGWAEIGMGKNVSDAAGVIKVTGILSERQVVHGLMEVLRRRELVGEAVYVSQKFGLRIANVDVGTLLQPVGAAKL